ncbi:MAG: hypothetical protein WBZ36_18870 [Candidatus Nitrosopolaris sp.]
MPCYWKVVIVSAAAAGANMTNATAAAGANMTQPIVALIIMIRLTIYDNHGKLL